MDKSTKEIQELIGFSYSATVNLIRKLSNGMTENEILGTKKGPKFKENSAIKSQVSAIVESDNSLVQNEIVDILQSSGITRTQGYVSRLLKKMGITRKRLTRIPFERNCPRVIDARHSYVREMEFVSNDQLVFLDETGVNLHTSSNYGYSTKNIKAYPLFSANKGTNISVMAAITSNGVLAYELKVGAYNSAHFIDFILRNLILYFVDHPNSVLVMDNC